MRRAELGASFASGLLFGLGLIVSGMSDPSKVLGFLDITGRWDPSLALVMAGAIAVGLVGFRAAGARAQAALGGPMHLPRRRDIGARLLLGSAVFGVGWGLAGICPGPAVVALGTLQGKVIVFVLAMFAGMRLIDALDRGAAPLSESLSTLTWGHCACSGATLRVCSP